ncbi:hypothetical protein H4R33_002970 [Dimargaris cristalligena]|uniref:Uncharacterized protein n=1 Tax=Dimargaris cristalligena TaxID=215637 RepID=A0A4P9ZM49_9FUNG|nr:hypothetical protein H4R33_002970 [Dimargaris cristalligena]RKP34198.1 hypothetical protein BJ085DRAFT_32326 [Dimargaris cristalligena]|eukprot:RKP34198.1 hypothetical protein BJ085DRAFT_32326 [Dimargaris cristalligena]
MENLRPTDFFYYVFNNAPRHIRLGLVHRIDRAANVVISKLADGPEVSLDGNTHSFHAVRDIPAELLSNGLPSFLGECHVLLPENLCPSGMVAQPKKLPEGAVCMLQDYLREDFITMLPGSAPSSLFATPASTDSHTHWFNYPPGINPYKSGAVRGSRNAPPTPTDHFTELMLREVAYYIPITEDHSAGMSPLSMDSPPEATLYLATSKFDSSGSSSSDEEDQQEPANDGK